MSEMPKVPELVQTIANMITELKTRGWSRGSLVSHSGNGVCLSGAGLCATKTWTPETNRIDVANQPTFEALYAFLMDALHGYAGVGWSSLPGWNDTRSSVQEVLDFLNFALERAISVTQVVTT